MHEYQTHVETAGLVWIRSPRYIASQLTVGQIRATEDVLSLIRQMQELWLFGQLNTLEPGNAQDKVDKQASEVAALLHKLSELQNHTGEASDEQP